MMRHFFSHKTTLPGLGLAGIALMGLALLSGCDTLFGEPEENVLTKIEDAVWQATAPDIGVIVGVRANAEGRTNPAGPAQAKQKVPFAVRFTVNDEYQFIRWQAFQGGVLLAADQAVFENPAAAETWLSIQGTGNSFTVQPLTLARPRVDTTNLPQGGSLRVALNYPVRIYFAGPLAPDSLILEETGKPNFTNISITGKLSYGQGADVDLTDRFSAALGENDSFLVLTPLPDNPLPGNCNVTVTLGADIQSIHTIDGETYRIPLLKPVTLNYGVHDRAD
ncbi:putative lipoprotein [Treponema primitia ZAS-2]|uniref:Putative lipoprotein n=1 Tax=Treponema primitia (strain ATCC BAA-887 / DSM 12427 / ZAS-2) TaxID=545694 RepID=F5YNE4_TREPZ|nr:hypothetical protein [Treponema primitia]AEF85640.1 putative lipoprotein [Treponema primitia ZAS-2]